MANRTSCIEHPAKQALVIVREDYLAICNGDDCAAAILNYFEHWQNSKLDAFEQWQRQSEIADKTGEPRPQPPDVWIYASQEQIRFDLLFTYGERKVGDTVDWLVEVGFLSARHNPKHGWDRTKQYQFEVAFVQLAIREIADSMGAKVRNGEVQNRAIESSKSAEAIPEITTETTSENVTPSGDSVTPKPKRITPHYEHYLALIAAFGFNETTMPKRSKSRYMSVAVNLHAAQFPVGSIQNLYDFVADTAKRGRWTTWGVNVLEDYAPKFLKEYTPNAVAIPTPPLDDAELEAARAQSMNRFSHMRQDGSYGHH